jgi:hypothetical protein
LTVFAGTGCSVEKHEIDLVVQTTSTSLRPDLYNKPMARNSHILSETIELLLDGPRADRKKLGEAALKLMGGGLFRYRFYFPPMQAGLHEVFWHRPLVACMSRETDQPIIAPPDLITGYMTGYLTDNPDPANAVELWPRFRRREESLYALHNFNPVHDHYLHQTPLNLMALFDAWEMLGKRLLDDYAAQMDDTLRARLYAMEARLMLDGQAFAEMQKSPLAVVHDIGLGISLVKQL